MKPLIRKGLRLFSRLVLVVALLIVGVYVYRAFTARSMPPLEAWHAPGPDEHGLWDPPAADLSAFLEREHVWMETTYRDVRPETAYRYSRYVPDGPSSPVRDGVNLNASFVRPPEGEVRGGVLLVHGLSDSPYHMHALARVFAGAGYLALGLRLPGHGTVPGALTKVRWDDWYRAVAQAVALLRQELPGADAPLYLGGFSTGGALVLRHVMESIREEREVPDGLFLFAPAIAVTPAALVANWHGLISWMPPFRQFAWLRVQPEYDPFKYNSFPKNAVDQIYRLSKANAAWAEDIADRPAWRDRMPPILAFQSTVDATVQAGAVADLFARIAPAHSEFVLFDINRAFGPFFLPEVGAARPMALLDEPPGPGRVFVVRNRERGDGFRDSVDVVHLVADADGWSETPEPVRDAGLAWPADVYALSHLALPIAPEDPVYGREGMLGGLRARGEKGTLLLTDESLTRLRYNPFFSLLQARIEHMLATRFTPDSEDIHAEALP